jgi:hypothetical protein
MDPAMLAQMGAAQKKKGPAPKKTIPKLFANPNNYFFLKALNGLYRIFYVAKSTAGGLLWYSSLVMILYVVPTQLLTLKDQ